MLLPTGFTGIEETGLAGFECDKHKARPITLFTCFLWALFQMWRRAQRKHWRHQSYGLVKHPIWSVKVKNRPKPGKVVFDALN